MGVATIAMATSILVVKEKLMSNVEKYEKAGYRLFPIVGKKPTVTKWQTTEPLQYKIGEGNFGVNLQADDLIIDIDPRGFTKGDNPYKRLVELIPEIASTMIVRTGGGGLHLYLKKSSKIKTKKHHKNFKGVDFLSEGAYVVGAGSVHPNTAVKYSIGQGNFNSIVEAPDALLKLLSSVLRGEAKATTEDTVDDSFANTQKYIYYLENVAQFAVSGQGGNNTTFQTACRGRDFGLSQDATFTTMLSYWNSKCQPSWDASELEKIVQNAYKFNQDAAGKFHPSNQFDALDVADGDEVSINNVTGMAEVNGKTYTVAKEKTFQWHLTKGGEMQRNSIHNVCNFFNGYKETPELHGLLGFNTLNQNIEFLKRPSWLSKYESLTGWDDNDCNAVVKYLSTKLSFNANKNLIHDAALAVAQQHKYNPVIEYLESFKWDGKERIHNWLSEYMRVKETKYTKAVGELILRAAIRRVYDSGCKMDYMVVLEGEQGIGKSTMIEILGHKWYADLILNVHSPDTVDCMKNKWIIEVSEMEASKRADVQAMKSFLSRRIDTCRLAYARASKDFPRHSIFIGSFNPDAYGSSYIKDVTGDRRYLPLTVEGSTFLNFAKFKEDVGQIWAEAMVGYKENPNNPLYLTDRAAYDQAVKETAKRRNSDAWVEQISLWLDNYDGAGTMKYETSANEVYTHALSGQVERFNTFYGRRIANIMVNELGWEKKQKRVNGVNTRIYLRPDLVELL